MLTDHHIIVTKSAFSKSLINLELEVTLETIHIWGLRKLSNFQDPPPPLYSYVQNSSTPLILDVEFQTNPPLPLSLLMITGQSKEKHNPRMTYMFIRSFPQVSFRFQYQIIDLVWLSIDFFSFSWSQSHPQSNLKKSKTSFLPSSYSEKMCCGQDWAEASLSTFSWLYILVRAAVQKYHELFFLSNFLVIILPSTCFICITWKQIHY